MVEVEDLEDAERKLHAYMMEHCLEKKNFIGGQVMCGDEMLGYFDAEGNLWNRTDANYCMKKKQFDQIMENVKLRKLAKQN